MEPEIEAIAKPTKTFKAEPVTPSATQMRVARLAPETKIFKTGEQTQILETQLKNHPKYAAEIAADAEKRAQRLNKPLSPPQIATQQAKMAAAEAELPVAREGYERAVARVRALEEEIAKMPAALAESQKSLLEAAKNELNDAEFYFSQILNNAKTGESRVGLEQMRDAARKKMIDFADKIAEGEVIQLKKRDYNPEFIKKATALSKKKPLPSTKGDDFFTRVHDAYAQEYANRARQIQEELKIPAKGLSELNEKRKLAQELDLLKKMIQHADSESIIHRHNLALRQMQQRKLASERLKTTTTLGEKEPKIESLAKEKMFSQRLESASTPVERAQIVDEAVEMAVSQNPKMAKVIEKEGQELKNIVEEMVSREPKAPPSVKGEKVPFREAGGEGGGTKPPRPESPTMPGGEPLPRGAEMRPKADQKVRAKRALSWIKKIQFGVESALRKVPIMGKYWFTRDIMIGAISAAIDELKKDAEIPAVSSRDLTLFLGRSPLNAKGLWRAGIRKISKNIMKEVIGTYKVAKAASHYRKHETQKFKEYSPSVQKKAKEKAISQMRR